MMDEVWAVFVMAPVVIFLVIVAPIWLVLHYRSKGLAASGLLADEQQELDQLTTRAQQMSERIDALEGILDAQVVGWRDRQP
jgi:phage shock protein B